MEGFDALRFRWMLGERLAEMNIDPRGVNNIQMIRNREMMQWDMQVSYQIQLPQGPQAWVIARTVTDAEAAEIEDIEDWMQEEAGFAARHFREVLIPNRIEWFEYLGNLVDEMRRR